jgi:hypothetical protein
MQPDSRNHWPTLFPSNSLSADFNGSEDCLGRHIPEMTMIALSLHITLSALPYFMGK